MKILYVDDCPNLREIAEDTMVCDTCERVLDALYLSSTKQYDLIVLDNHGVLDHASDDEISALKKLAKNIVLYTGHVENPSSVFDAVFQKPELLTKQIKDFFSAQQMAV